MNYFYFFPLLVVFHMAAYSSVVLPIFHHTTAEPKYKCDRGTVAGWSTSDWETAGTIPALPAHVSKCPWAKHEALPT